MQNLTLGQYYPGKSVIHQLDPRTKLLALIPLIVGVTINENVFILCGLYILLAFLVYISKVSGKLFFRQVKPFIWLIGLTIIFHAFLTEGVELFRLPLFGFAVSREGLFNGAFFGMRLLMLITLSLLLMFTTAPTEMTDGLEKLLRPVQRIGLPADRFALMLGISFRFIPVLFEEAERIKKAQIARGADMEGKLTTRIYNISSIVIPLFVSVFNRADSLANALEARGFNNRKKRTYYNELRFRKHDGYAFMAAAMISIGIFFV